MIRSTIALFLLLFCFIGYNQFIKAPKWPNPKVYAPLIEELMLDAKAIQFNIQGHVAQQLEIKKIFHTKGENATHFVQPRVTINQPDGSSWHISANMGKSIHTKNGHKFTELEFSDQVEMNQFNSGNKKLATWKLFTDFISIYPKTKTMYTRAPVRIDNQNLSISAQGLSGNLNTQKIMLLKNVKTQYKST